MDGSREREGSIYTWIIDENIAMEEEGPFFTHRIDLSQSRNDVVTRGKSHNRVAVRRDECVSLYTLSARVRT